MNPTVAASLIGFGAQIPNYIVQNYQSNKAFEQNKQLAQIQNQYNIDQWNRENAYNSPMAQMNRFEMAGLNPNLIYGQQNLAANSPELVGGTPKQSPNANLFDAQAASQLALLKAQKENIEADTDEKTAGAAEKNAGADLQKAQKDHIEQFLNPYYKALEKYTNQEGLSVAIDNWLNGYVPVEYDENGNWTGNTDYYAEEYTKMNKIFDNAKQAIQDEYHMTHKDREYLDRIFEAMVNRDNEAINSELANLRANNATLQKLADKEWFQVTNFILGKLGEVLQGVAPIAIGISDSRSRRMNAKTNRSFKKAKSNPWFWEE